MAEGIIRSEGKVLGIGGLNVVIHSDDGSIECTQLGKQEYDLSAKTHIEEELDKVREEFKEADEEVKEYVDGKIVEVEEKIPSIEGLATQAYVDNEIERVEGEIPDVSQLAPTEYVNKELAKLDAKIPSIEGLATKASVEALDTRLTNEEQETSSMKKLIPSNATETNKLATKEDIPTKLPTDWGEIGGSFSQQKDLKNELDRIEGKIPSTQGLASETYVNNKVAQAVAPLATKEEVTDGLDAKQDVLTAGNGITIENGIISSVSIMNVSHDNTLEGDGSPSNPLKVVSSEFTDKQLDAINSGINAELVAKIGQGGGTINYCTNEMVDALWGTTPPTPPTPPTPDLYVEKVLDGGMGQYNFVDWEDETKPRYFGVPTSSISNEVPNFVIHNETWDIRVDVTRETKDTFETKVFNDMTFFKVYHPKNSSIYSWLGWYIDGFQGGVDVWLLMDSNTREPYVGDY